MMHFLPCLVICILERYVIMVTIKFKDRKFNHSLFNLQTCTHLYLPPPWRGISPSVLFILLLHILNFKLKTLFCLFVK